VAPGWRTRAAKWLIALRDTALSLLIAGAAQIALALALWPVLFTRYPQGFAMALSLVGFGIWLLSALLSLGARRRLGGPMFSRPETTSARTNGALLTSMRERAERAGCGFTLFLSSIIPLGLAFFIRVRADLARGMTWGELFPPVP